MIKKERDDLVEFNLFQTIVFVLFIINLVVLTIYDFRYKAVPDYLLLFSFLTSFFITKLDIYEALQSAFIVAGAFVILNFLVTFYIQNIKSRLLKDESLKTQMALGEGDIPLIASFSVILGVYNTFIAIFLSAILTIFYAIYLKNRKNEIEIPFIPFLVFGFLLEYFFNLSNIIKDFY
ncbi:peptidase A24 [Aliarcobacter trophiarum LMG 25534]|uniref:Peptidase A24 n=1 Tax=Aliarcobacter trophiarum LMG 25534 TaxID=1032241 RepID=A0ABY0F185_9BACT|nr:peptidase A24 [Aliarcobacter trophiarum]RXJ92293.1 peptidase A24 [Aliarcobacter trophiarum LMG 25534]